MFTLAFSSHIYFLLFETPLSHFVYLRPKTHAVATRVLGRKWVQSTELDIVNGSLCNLCALALELALHIFATQCWEGRNNCQLLRSCFFGSCHVWSLETFFYVGLAVYRFSLYLWPDPLINTLFYKPALQLVTLFRLMLKHCEGLLLMVLSMKKQLLLNNKPNSRPECKIHTLFQTKTAKIDILFMTKMAEKPYPLGPHIPI